MSRIGGVFEGIYSGHAWGGTSRSGPGSDPSATRKFRLFLEQFLRSRNVKNVVDLGCGDWASTRLINWSGVDYLGVDIVPDVVERNRSEFGRPGVRFAVSNFVDEALPPADLVICKEVLQHLPKADVEKVLAKLPVYRMAILVNDDCMEQAGGLRTLWRSWPLTEPNVEIEPGGYRPLRLREAPFNLDAELVLDYWNKAPMALGNRSMMVQWHKEVLLWTNPAQT
jgi:SAM-dependent methyltransferase